MNDSEIRSAFWAVPAALEAREEALPYTDPRAEQILDQAWVMAVKVIAKPDNYSPSTVQKAWTVLAVV